MQPTHLRQTKKFRLIAPALIALSNCSAQPSPKPGADDSLCGQVRHQLTETLYSDSSAETIAAWCGPTGSKLDVHADAPYEACALEVPLPSNEKYAWAQGYGENSDEYAFEFFDRTAAFSRDLSEEWRARCGEACCYRATFSKRVIRY